MEKQRTLKAPVEFKGVGLHTGKLTTMTIKPAPAGTWYVFKRVDIEGKPEVKADVAHVFSTQRGTSLKKGEAEVHTTEHILAALYGLQIDNAIIELDGPEIPIMDGSSKEFVEKLEATGYQDQEAIRTYFELNENIKFEDPDKGAEILAVPDVEHRITVMVDYGSPMLGTQHASMYDVTEFKEEISSCRTFVFVRELIQLVNAGLIKGGDVDNAIVMMDREIDDAEKKLLNDTFNRDIDTLASDGIGYLNNLELRFRNEPARHKLLDIVGDLALVGKPMKLHILAARPGHKSNTEFAAVLKKQMKKQAAQAPRIDWDATPLYDSVQIPAILPHRYPFLLVDKIMELQKGSHVIGVKNITRNEEFFNGHFPGEPVMPGVLIIEAMAQTGGFLALADVDDPERYSTYFLKIENAKFKNKVVPGDVLVMKLELIAPIRRGVAQMKATAFVGDKIVTEAELLAQIVKNK